MSELIASQPDTPLKAFADESKRFRTTSLLDESPTLNGRTTDLPTFSPITRAPGAFSLHMRCLCRRNASDREERSELVLSEFAACEHACRPHRRSHAWVMHMLIIHRG